MKRIFIAILTLILLLQSTVALAITYDGGNSLVKVSEWEQYKTDEFLDSSLPYSITVGSNSYNFNKELWEELSLVVYGDYSSIYPNDFKTSTLNPTGVAYYSTGEYRYHGYNRSGSYVNNVYFPDDEVGDNNNLTDRTWCYEPWKVESPAYKNFGIYVGDQPGIYNDTALSDDPDAPLVAEWINGSVDFIDKGTVTGTDEATHLDPVYYNNVDSAPTGYSSGQGTLFHQSNYTEKIYYQTFSIEKYDKKYTEIEADIPQISVINIADNGDMTLKINVTGEIQDETYIGDSIKESIYYTRKDISEWNFTLTNNITGEELTAKGINKSSNKIGYNDFLVTIPCINYKNFLNIDNSYNITFTATAKALYSTNETAQDIVTKNKNVTGVIEDFNVTGDDEIITIEFDVNAPHKILDVDLFPLSLAEIDVSDAVDRYIILSGVKLSKADENKFLSGQYKFPEIMEDKVYDYSINYIDTEGEFWFFSSSIVVYDSIPHAQVKVSGALKENRKISVTADKSITSDYLESRSTVIISEFSITTDDGENICFGTNTSALKEFLRKSEGNINVHVRVSNEYGYREYDHHIYVSPDYDPDIISIIWNNVLTRNEALNILSEGTSLDGDTVVDMKYQILYDTDNDEIPETEVYSGTWEGSTDYVPDKLGNYKILFTATEEFGEETISEYITDEDKRTNTLEREFFVDNLIPMTKIYTDIEYNFPALDVSLLIDEGLSQDETDFIRKSQVDLRNNFRANSMTANVDIWDLKTYTFDQTAYQQVNSGNYYPSSSISYSNNGYEGTLYLDTASNYPYTVDYGRYVTNTDSFKTSTSSSNAGSGYTSYDKYGRVTGQWSTSNSSVGYNSGGYSGTLYQSGYWISSSRTVLTSRGGYTVYKTYGATYEGTVSKTWQEWVPNYVSFNNYYGNYSGKVYKDIKQDYTPDYENDSNKYIIYFASNSINDIADFAYVKDIARDSKVILVSNSSLQNKIEADYFIPYSADTTTILDEIVSICKGENTIYNGYTVLIDEMFEIIFSDIDVEGDPIIADGLQYVHDPYYLDNSLGQEIGTLTMYSNIGYTTDVKSSFSCPGLYTIYRRIKDKPVDYEHLGDYSNIAELQVVAHRKPIADVYMDWDFDAELGRYNTTWVDLSYDPDFQYSRIDKGIVDRSIKYKSSTGEWIYGIPDNLEPDTYTLEYIVMDNFGIWSDPLIIEFTLDEIPDMQLEAYLKTENPSFSVSAVPVGENLLIYDTITRYPYDTYLELAIYDGETRISPIKTVYFEEGTTGTKTDSDIYWNDITYIVPMTLEEITYNLRVKAIGVGNRTAYVDLPFTVIALNVEGFVMHTDLWNEHRIDYNLAMSGTKDSPRTYDVFFPGEKFILNADTIGNPTNVKVEILEKPYSTTLYNEGNNKWVGSMWDEEMMHWGTQNLTFRFIAKTESGTTRTYDVPIKIIDDEYWRQHRLY